MVSKVDCEGLQPNLYGKSAQCITGHSLTSFGDPQEHSRHFARIDLTGVEYNLSIEPPINPSVSK